MGTQRYGVVAYQRELAPREATSIVLSEASRAPTFSARGVEQRGGRTGGGVFNTRTSRRRCATMRWGRRWRGWVGLRGVREGRAREGNGLGDGVPLSYFQPMRSGRQHAQPPQELTPVYLSLSRSALSFLLSLRSMLHYPSLAGGHNLLGLRPSVCPSCLSLSVLFRPSVLSLPPPHPVLLTFSLCALPGSPINF